MSFSTRCSFCGHEMRAPDGALAASVRCPQCENYFTAVPPDEALPAQTLARFRLAPAPNQAPLSPTAIARSGAEAATGPVPAADREVGPAPMPGMALPANRPLAARLSQPEPRVDDSAPPQTETGRAAPHAFGIRVHVVGLLALLMTAAGLSCASIEALTWLTMPLAGVSLATALAAAVLSWSDRRPALLLPIAAGCLSAALIIVGSFFPRLLGPVYASAGDGPPRDASALVVIPLALSIADTAELTISGWVDASRAALQQDEVRVQVAGARMVPLELGGAKQNYVLIRLRLQHVGVAREIGYEHWKQTAAAKESPRLLEDSGRALPAAPWDNGNPPVHDQLDKEKLYPGTVLDDVLVFRAPAASAKFLRLELPAAAWGGAGHLKFHLPVSMIRKSSAKE